MALFYKFLFFLILLLNFLISLVVFHFFHLFLLSLILYIILTIVLIEGFSHLIQESFQNHGNVFFRVFPIVSKIIERQSQKIDKLSLHRSNLLKVIENIKLGVLLVDSKNTVILSNSYISFIFGCNIEQGQSIIDGWKNYKVLALFDKFIKENFQKVEFEHKILKFNKISIENGYIIIIEDVTKEESYQAMKMNFFSNASHELKTPITSIVGYAETLLLNKDIDKKDQNKFLKYIYKNALNLNDLINNILQLAEIEHFKQSNDVLTDINVEALLSELNINHLLNSKSIEFIKECSIKTIHFNEYHLKTILNNLLDNAFFYTKEGYIKLKCYEDDSYYIFEVEDSGIGIEKSHQEKIFERFYKIKSKGSGLGLAIVKHLVLLYNGSIDLESTVGVGSLFRIKFPKKNE
ncbi:MAG: sensor histidine kinase [Desulfurella sp.]|jgi:two-component system phosphate regulon sensor histidine kinase PhoR|uniref:histidine kinase n=3 Tax=Desulfurella TaxID=33001 RepID=A0A1G6PSN3_9BACT|nr:HAMP domain-containing sensor histidine kinase [Desulfurella multipotens]PMP63179.1 MAG: GHKL domain-containing protein [Desulfurella multipotens]SDC83143.1 two-component system, OmpR family, phosphate regulon sensor histidine kinase PhoR [Desulfurella multipotens]